VASRRWITGLEQPTLFTSTGRCTLAFQCSALLVGRGDGSVEAKLLGFDTNGVTEVSSNFFKHN
jgi:hypothetical protein